jgi:pimeloyl-ACP methyl ester carboxylesterase
VISPRYAADFKAGLREGRTAVVAGAGHMLQYEQPKEVELQVEAFDKAAQTA